MYYDTLQRVSFKKVCCLEALPDYIVNGLRLEENLETNCARVKKSQYHIRLEERQKMCFHHGLIERQLLKYVCIVGKVKGSTGQVLIQLDNILFRLGMASTIPQ